MGESEKLMNLIPEDWGKDLIYVDCENCQSSFLITKDHRKILCPNCHKSELETLEFSEPDFSEINIPPPEFFMPFEIGNEQIQSALKKFFQGFWFRPADLRETNLLNRMLPVYLPVWLVDASVFAEWQVEAGFNYQVVSHKDRFDDRQGGWQTQEVQETRLRWESRLGRLQRTYQNISAPALDNHSSLIQRLGPYANSSRIAFDPNHALRPKGNMIRCIRLPDRHPEDAWTDAQPGFERAAISECQQAIGADALRSFRWVPEFSDLNWTLNLLPIFTTYYRDDEGEVQVLLLNGQNGQISGVRKASKIKARNVSLWILLAGFIMFMISLLSFLGGLIAPIFFPLGLLGLGIAVVIGLVAVFPVLHVWSVNRKQRSYSVD